MKISTKTHGILDYLIGILLIASPWLFDFANGSAAQHIPVTLGIATLIMSFFTNYELGAVKSISLGAHLTMDTLSGLFLVVSPWLFNFSETVYLPHLVFGLLEIGVVFITRRDPYSQRTKPKNKVNTQEGSLTNQGKEQNAGTRIQETKVKETQPKEPVA